MYIKPAPGMQVVDPARLSQGPAAYLPAEGREVELTDYWRRRLAEGGVVEATPPAAPSDPVATADPAMPTEA